jgi:uncharacterized protein
MALAKSTSSEPPVETWITDRADGAVVSILASAKANAIRVGPVEGNELRVRITAAPVEGAANAAIVKALADATRIPKTQIELLSGQSSRHKRVLFRGFSAADVRERLRSLI